MATIKGTTTLSLWTFKIETTEKEQSIENNSTKLGIEFFIGRGSSESFLGYPEIDFTATVAGIGTATGKYEPKTRVDVPANGWVSIGSVEITVPHDPDGRKTASITASFTNDVSPSSGSATGTVTLTTIPRASSLSFNDVFTIGDNVSFTITRHSAAFSHKIYMSYLMQQDLIAENVTESYEWDTGTWSSGQFWKRAKDTAPGETMAGSIVIYTFNGNVNVGSAVYPFTATVPTEYEGKPVKPNLSAVLSPITYGASNLSDNYIATKSRIKADFTDSEYNTAIGFGSVYIKAENSKISATSTDANNLVVETERANGFITTSGKDIPVYVGIIDAAGRKVEQTVLINVDAYSEPYVSEHLDKNGKPFPIVQRVRLTDNGYEPSKRGTALKVMAKRNYESLEDNANGCSLRYELVDQNSDIIAEGFCRDVNGNEMTDSVGDNNANFVIEGATAETDKTYVLNLFVTDSMGGTGSLRASVAVSNPTWHAPKGGNGFSLGEAYDQDKYGPGNFVSSYRAKFNNGIEILNKFGQYMPPDYIEEKGYGGGWTYVKYSNGLAEAWGDVTDRVYVTNTQGTLYYGEGMKLSYPFNFEENPLIIAVGRIDGPTTFIADPVLVEQTTTYMQFRHYATTQGPQDDEKGRPISIYLKGFHKQTD